MSIEDLLASEKKRAGFSPEQRASLWRGIEVAVVAPAAPSAPSGANAAKAAAHGKGALTTLKLGALLSIAALGGAAVGAYAHAKLTEPRVVIVERSAPAVTTPPTALAPATASLAVSVAPLAPTTGQVLVAASPSAIPTVPKAASAPPSSAPKDTALARERTLLDMARTAIGRGDVTGALSSLDTHAREFPRSQLGEEREVLAIQALASSNRPTEARARAATFRATYPKSPLLSIVNEATE